MSMKFRESFQNFPRTEKATTRAFFLLLSASQNFVDTFKVHAHTKNDIEWKTPRYLTFLMSQICDFGLARVCDTSHDHTGVLTEYVATRYNDNNNDIIIIIY